MARYFHYKSSADLLAENARLGLDLRLTDDFSPLFKPVPVGPLAAGNALCVQPMEGCDGTPAGAPDDLTMRRYTRFGAGGAKLIWGEAAAVADEGRANPRQLWINDANLPAIAAMHDACRAAHRDAFGRDDDLIVGLQLTHSGRYSYRRPLIACHDAALDPRTVADKATGRTVDDAYPLVSDDDLKRLVDAFVAAAKRAYSVGFQFVDLKQCHKYLLCELLGARSRPGPYGGSFENRTRLARDIILGVRAAVPGLLIATRMNLFDGVPYRTAEGGTEGEPCPHPLPLVDGWGTNLAAPGELDLSEPLRWVAEMKALGVVMVNGSLGNPYAAPHYLRPFEYPPPDGYETPEHPLIGVDRHFRAAETVQRANPDLPVVGSGYSYLQEFLMHAAAANVRDGRCRFAGVGRATLSQPDFVKQVMDHGKLDRKRVCRTFSTCTALMRAKGNALGQFASGCPPFDKAVYGPIWAEVQGLK